MEPKTTMLEVCGQTPVVGARQFRTLERFAGSAPVTVFIAPQMAARLPPIDASDVRDVLV